MKNILERTGVTKTFLETSNTDKCADCRYCKLLVEKGTTVRLNGLNVRFPTEKLTSKTKFIVYAAICGNCPCFYIGKTFRKCKERIYQHIYALKKCDPNNALFRHLDKTGHRSFKFVGIQSLNDDGKDGC